MCSTCQSSRAVSSSSARWNAAIIASSMAFTGGRDSVKTATRALRETSIMVTARVHLFELRSEYRQGRGGSTALLVGELRRPLLEEGFTLLRRVLGRLCH